MSTGLGANALNTSTETFSPLDVREEEESSDDL
jgi:hypothetical protein